MKLHDPGADKNFGYVRPVHECAQCGAPLYVPEWSEYLDSGGVRDLWQCEACHTTFETTVRFAA